MQAQIIHTWGGAERFEAATLPDPTPGPGEVLVQVAATSVNPADYKLRQAGPPIAPELPAVLGCDVAGRVLAVGDGVAGFAEGDEVYGCVGGVRGMPGCYAEMIAADARLLAPKPASLTLREAAALPLVTITAWEGLARAGVRAGQTVLVHGGAGGVGHVAIQLAKAWGAEVSTTVSSEEKAALARSFGADHTIDYRAEPLDDYVARLTGGKGFDVVYDATGGSDIAASFQAARLNGQIVAIVSQYDANLAPMHLKGLSLHVVFMLIPMLHDVGRAEHGRILREAAALADAGKLRPHLDPKRFDLAATADAPPPPGRRARGGQGRDRRGSRAALARNSQHRTMVRCTARANGAECRNVPRNPLASPAPRPGCRRRSVDGAIRAPDVRTPCPSTFRPVPLCATLCRHIPPCPARIHFENCCRDLRRTTGTMWVRGRGPRRRR